MADPTEQRLDDHDRRLERIQRTIEDNRRLLDDMSSALFGDSSRLLRGHEERLQILEKAVSELSANWAQLMTRIDTLSGVGRAIAWLLGFVGFGLIVNVAQRALGG